MSIHAESEESAQTRVLKLEKENKHLQALINTYKDSIKSSEITQVRLFLCVLYVVQDQRFNLIIIRFDFRVPFALIVVKYSKSRYFLLY